MADEQSSQRAQNVRHIRSLYGLSGDVAIDCLWAMLDDFGLDAFTDDAIKKLADLQRSANALNSRGASS